MARIEVADNADALSHAAAERFSRLTTDAVRARGRCFVALSGGTTPRRIYQLLASEPLRSRVPWEQIEFFWGDERHVPPDHADSNYRMAADALLSKVPVRPKRIHHIRAEIADAALAAQEYEVEIRTAFGEPHATPRFDVILLGLGADGHTASLFPGTTALDERRRLCVANWVAALGAHRITMTLPLLNAARNIVFIVSGEEKAAIVAQVLQGTSSAPASLVQPTDGEVSWMLDRSAAP